MTMNREASIRGNDYSTALLRFRIRLKTWTGKFTVRALHRELGLQFIF